MDDSCDESTTIQSGANECVVEKLPKSAVRWDRNIAVYRKFVKIACICCALEEHCAIFFRPMNAKTTSKTLDTAE